MIVESALCVDAVALAVLVGSLAPLLIPIRKPVAQSEYLLVRMNAELPLLLKEIQATTENLTRSSSMRQCCCNAAGTVGDTVQRVQKTIQERADRS